MDMYSSLSDNINEEELMNSIKDQEFDEDTYDEIF